MTEQAHNRAFDLFHKLRELPSDECPSALDEACEGDTELRATVSRLLAADRKMSSDSFLARPALQDAADLLSPEPQRLALSGTVLGKYRLGRQIGAGGMGLVYSAEDLGLGRRVAVKILSESRTVLYQERIQRFEREARASGQLNHPHIASILEAGFDQGIHYIAMEHVEGRTLRQWISSESKSIDSRTVLDLLGQVASALSAAHAAGIIHRDIKPENIMVRPDGFVKVLDFGLAAVSDNAAIPPGGELRTRPGNLVGTLQYLSPEQVLGKPATALSDLFSLGVVAYELSTGVRPFDGLSDGAIFDAIVHRDPPLPSAARPELGSELDELIMRLLEKDPDLRLQTASDLRSSCRWLTRGNTATPPDGVALKRRASDHVPKSNRQIRLWLLSTVVAAAALLAVAFWLWQPLPLPHVAAIYQVTHDGLPKEFFVNDGKRLYYSAGSDDPKADMFQISAGGGDPVAMPQLRGLDPLDISADGSRLLLGQRQKGPEDGVALWTVPALGGQPRRIGDLVVTDARWSPSGDLIAYCNPRGLLLAQSDGSNSRVIAKPPGYVHYLEWSPDGRLIRFTSDFNNVPYVFEISSDGSGLHRLSLGTHDMPGQHGIWTADAKYFLFSGIDKDSSDIWAAANSRRLSWLTGTLLTGSWSGGRPAARPVRLTNGPLIADYPEPAPDGQRVFFRGKLKKGELVRYDPQSRKWVSYLNGLPGMQLDFSRDGRWITYVQYPDGSVWRSAANGTDRRQLTTSAIFARNPRWSPDGTQIVFYGAPPGESERVYLVRSEGGSVRQLTHSVAGPSGNEGDGNWSPDSRLIAFSIQPDPHVDSRPESGCLATFDLTSGRISKLAGSEALWSPRWSPDGRYFAAIKSPDSTLWLYDPVTHQQRQLTNLSVAWPHWSNDSRYVYFSNHLHTYRVGIGTRHVESLADFDNLRTADVSLGWIGLSPDNSLISTRDAGSTEIYAVNWEMP